MSSKLWVIDWVHVMALNFVLHFCNEGIDGPVSATQCICPYKSIFSPIISQIQHGTQLRKFNETSAVLDIFLIHMI